MIGSDLQGSRAWSSSGLLAAQADWAPENIAMVFEEQQFTYREFNNKASEVAAALMALGLEPGDAVGILMTNRPEYLFASYGINRAGLVTVSVNAGFKADFLSYPLDHADAKLLVTEAKLAENLLTIGALPKALRTIVYVDDVPPQVPAGNVTILSWDEFVVQRVEAFEFPVVQPTATGAISFTSGTTGRSKGVVSPNLQGVVMGREAAAAFEITPRDRMYTCMPLFHGMAQVTTGMAAFSAGATMVLSRGFSVTRFWEEIRQSGATQASALGSMMHMLLTTPSSPNDLDHKVTRFFSAPAPAEVLYRFERRFGVHVIEGYGSTEIKNVLYNPIAGRKIGSLGKPTATSILEIHDEHGKTLPPGVVGEIVYRPRIPHIMLKHYHRDPEKTLAQMGGLWWHTGDMGSMDEDGFFFFSDRTADRLRRRGENISSLELENVLTRFPGIAEAAAVAVKSDVGEDEVLAVLEVHQAEGFEFEALLAHCIDRMPRFMVPRYYRLLRPLPRTPTGKVLKNVLRDTGLTADTWDHVAAGAVLPR